MRSVFLCHISLFNLKRSSLKILSLTANILDHYGTFIAFLLCHDFLPRYQSCFEVVLGYCEKRESTSILVDITAKDDLRIIILNMSWRQDFGHNMETLLQAEQKKLQNMFRPWLETREEEKIILGYVQYMSLGKWYPKIIKMLLDSLLLYLQIYSLFLVAHFTAKFWSPINIFFSLYQMVEEAITC